MLIKVRAGDVTLGRPTDFAIYSAEGQLLLREGQVITSESLLDRLYLLGHREGQVAAGKPSPRATVEARPTLTEERNQLLLGTSHPPEHSLTARPLLPGQSASLPSLGKMVEFFNLTPAGGEEALCVELIGVVSDQALIVRHLVDEDEPTLTAGVVYDAQLFTGSRLFKFTTRLLHESVGPVDCRFLQYPESVSQASVRKHQRVPTSIPGRLLSGEYQRPAANVTVDDVSAIGVKVSAREDLLTVGQSAQLSMNLSLDSHLRPVTVVVEVRNRQQHGEQFSYGLEFVRISEEVRRDIKDFVLESMALL
jgi:hypothetical protein